MKILVLGGTSFVGRAIVDDALSHGHDVTIFSRGQTGSDLFPGVERLRGDRDTGDYEMLRDRHWDGVVDVSAYVPRHVGQALDALHESAGQHLFISTVSVYDRHKAAPVDRDEGAPRLPGVRNTEEVNAKTYGGLKVACEDDVLTRLGGGGATIVRPGIVAGPHDPTDRFTWWVRAASQGGRVEAPVRADQPVQVVDSRDLARLVNALLETGTRGIFNAVGPAEPTTLAGLLKTCASAAGALAELRTVPGDADDVPLALPDESWDAIFRRSAARAYAAGMPATPLARTAADVLAWDRARGLPPLHVD